MQNNTEIVILRGPSGSGKSTYAREHLPNHTVISRDLIRPMFGAQSKTRLTTDLEKKVTEIQVRMFRDAIRRGENVVIDDTNIENGFANRWATEAALMGVPFREVVFDTPLGDCVERSDIPENVVIKQHGNMNRLRPAKAVADFTLATDDDVYSKIPAYIVDIDGTLARHHRSPYDYDKLHTDTVICPVAETISLLCQERHVLLVSGRPNSHYKQTRQWLKANGVSYDELYMRTAGDNRSDAVVKSELLDKIMEDYSIIAAIDDRQRVLEMWRTRGIFTFDVSQGGGMF